MERLRDLMRERRDELGLSLTDLAQRSGVDRMHLWALEKERKRNPTVATLHALAEALVTPFERVAAAARASYLAGEP